MKIRMLPQRVFQSSRILIFEGLPYDLYTYNDKHTSIKMAANAIDINPLIKITRNSFKMGLLAKNRPSFAQEKFDW